GGAETHGSFGPEEPVEIGTARFTVPRRNLDGRRFQLFAARRTPSFSLGQANVRFVSNHVAKAAAGNGFLRFGAVSRLFYAGRRARGIFVEALSDHTTHHQR